MDINAIREHQQSFLADGGEKLLFLLLLTSLVSGEQVEKNKKRKNADTISEVVNSGHKNGIDGKRGKGDHRFECNQVDSDACQWQHTLLIGVRQK